MRWLGGIILKWSSLQSAKELGVELGVGRMEGVYGVYDIWYGVWYVWYMVWYMVFMGMIVIV